MGTFDIDSIARDKLVDEIADALLDAVGYADSFEARDFVRRVVADAQIQWERIQWERMPEQRR